MAGRHSDVVAMGRGAALRRRRAAKAVGTPLLCGAPLASGLAEITFTNGITLNRDLTLKLLGFALCGGGVKSLGSVKQTAEQAFHVRADRRRAGPFP